MRRPLWRRIGPWSRRRWPRSSSGRRRGRRSSPAAEAGERIGKINGHMDEISKDLKAVKKMLEREEDGDELAAL